MSYDETVIERAGGWSLRIGMKEYKGHRYVDIRKWYKNTQGHDSPDKAGVTVRLNELETVVEALTGLLFYVKAEKE